jgi:transposase-like protein
VDQETLVEYRYRAVCEVLGGSPISEVALRYGTMRQSLDTWRTRFKQEGVTGESPILSPPGLRVGLV